MYREDVLRKSFPVILSLPAKYLTLILFVSFLSGCGTVNTVFRGDEIVSNNLTKKRTYCNSIPRVYSGAAYNFCILRGEPTTSVSLQAVVIQDFVLSGMVDTLVLPYTIYRQVGDGNIAIGRGTKRGQVDFKNE